MDDRALDVRLGPCAGKKEDFIFDKDSVKVMRIEEMHCDDSIDVYLVAVVNDICGGVTCRIYTARNTRKSDSLGEDFLEHCSYQRE